ncbi:MAG: CoA pyrophosphatase [Flavobacteriales bacterium]
MISTELINNLKKAFENELPGMESHLEMTPYRRLTKIIPENRREGAILMMLYPKNGELYFPLIQRHEYEGVHSNQVSFPGGKAESFDKNLYHTALRETEEEIGVNQIDVSQLGEMSQVYIPPSNFLVSAFLSFHNELPQFVKEEKEVKEILEIPVSSVLDPRNIKTTEIKMKNGMKLSTPYFDLEEKIVWGATAAILAEFKAVFNSLPKL